MPSRKKAKGKARRAKAKAKDDCDSGNEISLLVGNLSLNSKNKCTHGRRDISSDHICFHFVEEFEVAVKAAFEELVFKQQNPTCGPFLIYGNAINRVDSDLCTEISGNDDNVQILRSLLLSLGVDLLLSDREYSSPPATIVAIAVLFVQHKFDIKEVRASDTSARALHDLNDGGSEEDTTRILSKRIPCNCLKEKHAQAKAETKVGMCSYCRKLMDRKELMLCGGCKIPQYCSVECQKADWTAGHKNWCLKKA